MKEVLVVIPYCSSGAQGRELEYAVAGWRRHFREPHKIVLAGEGHPVTKTGDDICCVPSRRVPKRRGQYRQHLDYVSCLRKVRTAFPESTGCIMVADDCYAVRDFDMADVMQLKQQADRINGNPDSGNAWQRDKAKTEARLREEGYPTRNFTTHLPQWFEWARLEELWSRYHMDRESYVVEDLYYNIFCGKGHPLQLHQDLDWIKFGAYSPDITEAQLRRAFAEKIWITNSPDGWTPTLDRLLKEYYFG